MWIRATARDAAPAGPVARGGGARTAICLALTAGLLCTPPHGIAADTPAPVGDEAIVTVQVNGIGLGDFIGIRTPDDFWIASSDLPRLRLAGPAPPPSGGFVSLRALAATGWRFDESALLLQLDLPSAMLQGTRIDVGTTSNGPAGGHAPASLILSYRLSSRTSGPTQSTQAETDLNVRLGGLLLRQENRLNVSGAPGQRRLLRGRTQAIFDEPEQARRWVAGDVLSTGGAFAPATTGAGLLVSKVWGMTPDAIRQPRARIQASTALPADVELTVDGASVYRGRVGPGPIELENLQNQGGQRNLRLTITDSSGRQQVIEQPFLFTDTVLASGVHDYAYFAGRRSELDAAARWRYGGGIAQGFHRYGWSDSVTLSAGGEASADFHTVGSGVTLRLDRLGLVSLDALNNHDRESSTTRTGWSGRYTYQLPRFSVVASLRGFDAGFRSFQAAPGLFPLNEKLVSISGAIGRTSVGFDWIDAQTTLGQRTSAALRIHSSLSNSSLISAEFRSTKSAGQRSHALTVFWRAYLDRDSWRGATLNVADSGNQVLTLDAGRQVPSGEGFGYRASVIEATGGGAPSRTAALGGTVNLGAATLDLQGAQEVRSGTNSLEASLSGALLAIGGHVGAARLVGDSFALARLALPVEGIDVLVNNQVQGKTDRNGELLIPNLASFDRQEVAIDSRQVPMAYQVERPALLVAPPFRSGTVVQFGLSRVRAVAGKAWRLQEQVRTPLAHLAWTMVSGTRQLKVETTATGDFYVDNVEPGVYTGRLRVGPGELSCKLQIPESMDPVQELEEGIVCE